MTIVCTPPFPLLRGGWVGGGGAGESWVNLLPSLRGSQSLEGSCSNKGVAFFSVSGCSFSIKNKLKSEIFNDKKVYKQRSFSLT